MRETVFMDGRNQAVVALREVAPPVGIPGDRWMTVEDAEAAGVEMAGYDREFGPRRRGVVYYGAYWGNVNTVHDVFVNVKAVRDERGRFAGRRVVGYQVAEESADDDGRIRRHMTSWRYDTRNQVLFTLPQ